MKKNVKLDRKNALVFAVGGGAVLVLLLGYLLLISPKQKAIADLKSQTAAVRQQISDDLSRAALARSATGAPQIKTADVYRLETAMPSIADMPDLLLELDQTAAAAGVSIDSISPKAAPSTDSASYSTVDISLDATGNFYSIMDLLYRLRNMVYVRGGALEANGRIFSVTSIKLAPVDSQESASITLETYVYTPSATPTSTSTTLTPGATTTTTTTTPPPAAGPSAAGVTP